MKGKGKFSSADAVKTWLESRGVDTSTWGVGKAKTLESLLEEIEGKESTLQVGNTAA